MIQVRRRVKRMGGLVAMCFAKSIVKCICEEMDEMGTVIYCTLLKPLIS